MYCYVLEPAQEEQRYHELWEQTAPTQEVQACAFRMKGLHLLQSEWQHGAAQTASRLAQEE